MRSVAPRPDPQDLGYVKLHEAQRLVMPLPEVLQSDYPELKLKTLTDAIAKGIDANKPPPVAKAPNQLKGEGDIFLSQGTPQNAGNLFGVMEGDMGMAGGSGGYNPYAGMMRSMLNRKGVPGATGENTYGQQTMQEQPDYCLIRIVDSEDIRPGVRYQYRMRLSMDNPNSGKKDLVAKPSDAAQETITGDWAETPGTVTVPQESFLYAVEPPAEAKKGSGALREGQAILQIQRWQPQIQVDRQHAEPFGDWLVAEIPVTRGQYVGGRQLVSVPFWSSEVNGFVLRDAVAERKAKGRQSDEPRRGVFMNLSQPGLLVVDVEGGKVPRFQGSTRRSFDDESAYEVLLLGPDGKLRVQNSAEDTNDAERKAREERFKKWVADVASGAATTQPGTTQPGRFD
jgi:hypothetical protein